VVSGIEVVVTVPFVISDIAAISVDTEVANCAVVDAAAVFPCAVTSVAV